MGRDGRSGDHFHTDIDYEDVPSSATIFLCHTAPQPAGEQHAGEQGEGATEFVDTAGLYESLPHTLRDAADQITVRRSVIATNSFRTARALGNTSPLVRRHHATGRRAIWGSPPSVRTTEYSGPPPETIERVLAAIAPPDGTGDDPAWRGQHRGGALGVSHGVSDDLERFVYRHRHERGDVTMWGETSTQTTLLFSVLSVHTTCCLKPPCFAFEVPANIGHCTIFDHCRQLLGLAPRSWPDHARQCK